MAFQKEKSYSCELIPHILAKTHTQIFMAALFTTAKPWKQPGCPSVGKWTSEQWYKHTKQVGWGKFFFKDFQFVEDLQAKHWQGCRAAKCHSW